MSLTIRNDVAASVCEWTKNHSLTRAATGGRIQRVNERVGDPGLLTDDEMESLHPPRTQTRFPPLTTHSTGLPPSS